MVKAGSGAAFRAFRAFHAFRARGALHAMGSVGSVGSVGAVFRGARSFPLRDVTMVPSCSSPGGNGEQCQPGGFQGDRERHTVRRGMSIYLHRYRRLAIIAWNEWSAKEAGRSMNVQRPLGTSNDNCFRLELDG